MLTGELFASVFLFGMMAGVFVIYMAMRQRQMQIEMQHRERMAMIERGQVPTDPPHPAHRIIGGVARSSAVGSRSMSVGIVVVAFGFGLMTIIGIAAGAPDVAVGIGGAIVILGVAFIANSLLIRHNVADAPPAPRQDDVR